MVFGQLRLYDVVSDLLPGLATISLLVPLFPAGAIVDRQLESGALLSGVYIVFARYLVGRAIHEMSGVGPVKTVIEAFDETFTRWNLHQRFAPKDVRRRFDDEADNGEQSDDETSGWKPFWKRIRTGETPVMKSIRNMMRGDEAVVRKSFQELMRADETPETASQQACEALADEFATGDHRYAAVEEFGESLLYGKNTLHNRYEMMAVLFRSLALVFMVMAVLYAGHSVAVSRFGYQSVWTARVPGWYPHYLVAPVLAFLAYPALHQRWLFLQRSAEAFANDLYVEMVRGDVVDVGDDLKVNVEGADTDDGGGQ